MIQITCKNGKSKKQFVFFTARKLEGFGQDDFHWMSTARILKQKSWFVRDTSNKFYHTDNLLLTSKILRHVVKRFKGPTIFVGSSMGGYGAILLSHYCQPQKVIAFSPSPKPGSMLHKETNFPEIEIHVCEKSKWNKVNGLTDPQNAELFKEHAKIVYHDCSTHNVAAHIRDKSSILRILEEA